MSTTKQMEEEEEESSSPLEYFLFLDCHVNAARSVVIEKLRNAGFPLCPNFNNGVSRIHVRIAVSRKSLEGAPLLHRKREENKNRATRR